MLTRRTATAGDVLDRVLSLLGTRGGGAVLLVDILVALVCAFIPLADHLGFEFAAVLTIANALVAPAAGAAAVREERVRPRNDRSFGVAAASAGVYCVILLLVPALLILLNGVRRPTCDPLSGAVWLLILPLPTALLAAATGGLARLVSDTNRRVAVSVALVELGSIGWGVWTIYSGPSFFLYDHFFGYLPGPIYDETVPFATPLLAFRALTLVWAMAVASTCSAWGGEPGPERSRATRRAAVLATLAVLVATFGSTRLGFHTTEASLANSLGGVRRIDQLEIHYPREWPEKTIESFARDTAFRASQVIQELGLTNPRVVRVYVYRSSEEKRRLVGASATAFTKPWRHELHINPSPFPHTVVRHELVHAFGAELSHGLWGTPGGLFPDSVLIEGFAVALDADTEGLTLPQWAKAMRELKLAPEGMLNIRPANLSRWRAFTSSLQFWTSAPTRAYQYSGAFLRFIDARYGRAKLLESYAAGQVTGDPKALTAEFHAWLDEVLLSPSERATAERHLVRPSVFRRQCAREVSQLEDRAGRLFGEGKKEESLAAWQQVCSMEPDDPALLQSWLQAAVKANDHATRDRVADQLLHHEKLDPVLHASTLQILGDDAWRQNDLTTAEARFREAAGIPADGATHRSAVVRSAAVRDPTLSTLLRPLLADGDAELRQLFAMDEYIRGNAEDRVVRYLLGRQLVQRGALSRGIPLLDAASDRLLDDQELSLEVLRLLVRAHAEQHHCDQAQDTDARLVALKAPEVDRRIADDWVARCRFEVGRGWTALAEQPKGAQ